MTTREISPPNPKPVIRAIGDNLTDILNISQLCTATGYSRPVIKRAIDAGEMKSFKYANQVCVLLTEYVRWVNQLGQAAS